MPNTEYTNHWWRAISDASGGSVKGDAFNGGEVALTTAGEAIFQVGDQGELLAIFPEKGIVCAYFDDQELAFISIEVGAYLSDLSAAVLDTMPHDGRDIMAMLEELELSRYSLFLTVFPKMGRVLLQVRDETQEELAAESEQEIDFNKGFLGLIGFGDDPKICYHAISRGDEFVVGLGEMSGKRKVVVPLSFGNEVDFIEEITSGRGDRFQRLTRKILLG